MAATVKRTGGSLRLRTPVAHLLPAAKAACELHDAGLTYRQVAEVLGIGTMTAYRRAWFWRDYHLPARHGCKRGPRPPLRSTRGCPRGRPYMPTLDGPREH